MAGAYALRAYAELLAKHRPAENLKENPEYLRQRRLAEYLEQTWPASQSADIARHVLGGMHLADKEYQQAVEVLDRISPSYSERTRSLYQLAGAALQAQKNDRPPPPGQPSYQERALAALTSIPDLRSAADAATRRDYFAAKLMLAEIYYQTKQHEKLQALAQSLTASLEGTDVKIQQDFRTSILALSLYAKLGMAEADYQAGRYQKVREVLAPLVREMTAPSRTAEFLDLKEKNPQLLRALLVLALRAGVQDRDMDHSRQIFEVLQKTFPESSLDMLVQLVQQIQIQLEELRLRGAGSGEELTKTVTSFSAFLDQLSRQQDKNPKPEITLFLGQSYSILDKHDRAAALLDTITEDAPPAVYHSARVWYARELRLSKEFAKAEAVLATILASDWGKQHLPARKESILLLEDEEKYQLSRTQGAIPQWNQLMLSLRPNLQDNRIKEQYFDCYYHLTFCVFRNALQKADDKLRQREMHTAATFIARLEEQADSSSEICKKRLRELLEKEPLLKEAYHRLKK